MADEDLKKRSLMLTQQQIDDINKAGRKAGREFSAQARHWLNLGKKADKDAA